MALLLLVILWNWVAIPYFIFLIIQHMFPTVVSDWKTFFLIILMLSMIRGSFNLAVINRE